MPRVSQDMPKSIDISRPDKTEVSRRETACLRALLEADGPLTCDQLTHKVKGLLHPEMYSIVKKGRALKLIAKCGITKSDTKSNLAPKFLYKITKQGRSILESGISWNAYAKHQGVDLWKAKRKKPGH